MIDAVLATDMAVHFELLKSFNSHMEATPDVRQWQVRPGCGPAPHPLGQGCAPRVCARLMGEAGRPRLHHGCPAPLPHQGHSHAPLQGCGGAQDRVMQCPGCAPPTQGSYARITNPRSPAIPQATT